MTGTNVTNTNITNSNISENAINVKDIVTRNTALEKPAAVQDDPVSHPAHYCDGIEVIDFIESKKNLGYHLGNVIKYICRAGKKDPALEIVDLRKAQWYLNRYIELLERTSCR